MLNVFTLGAGVAVAGLLPDRLALWQVPRVARAEVEVPGTVLSPAGSHGPLPSRKRLAAMLAPLIGAQPLGHHVGAVVTDLATGEVLFSRQAGSPFVPASNAKLLTAVAALSTLGPAARFTTRVVAGTRPASLGLPAADHARGARRLDRPLAVRAPRAHGAAGLRHLVVHRPVSRPGLDPRLHQHGQRHADHRARGGPGPADPVRGAAGRRQPEQLPAPVLRACHRGGERLREPAPPRRHPRGRPAGDWTPAAARRP